MCFICLGEVKIPDLNCSAFFVCDEHGYPKIYGDFLNVAEDDVEPLCTQWNRRLSIAVLCCNLCLTWDNSSDWYKGLSWLSSLICGIEEKDF